MSLPRQSSLNQIIYFIFYCLKSIYMIHMITRTELESD